MLEHGKVNPMLNVRFLVTNMLPFDEDGNRICPMWVKSRLVLSPWDQMKFSIVRPDKYQNLSVVRADAACMYGASRKDENLSCRFFVRRRRRLELNYLSRVFVVVCSAPCFGRERIFCLFKLRLYSCGKMCAKREAC